MTSQVPPSGEMDGCHSIIQAGALTPLPRSMPLPQDGRSPLSPQFPSPPPSLPPIIPDFSGTVGGTPADAARNEAQFRAAAVLLSQSPTGRHLLAQVKAAGYSVVFDDSRTAAVGASGLCDPHEKKIILSGANDRDMLALLLAHEAVHALQNSHADDLLPSTRHRPETIFRLSFAIEADAYAQQMQVAFELAKISHPAASRPLLLMRGRFPVLTNAADKAMQKAANAEHDGGIGALKDGRVMAALFNAFYDDAGLRSFYEKMHLEWLNDMALKRAPKPDGKAGQKDSKSGAFNQASGGLADMFRRDMTSGRLRKLLLWQNKPYVQQHRPDLDFQTPRYAGLSAAIRDGVLEFYKTWLPNRRAPDIAVFGLQVVPPAPSVKQAAHPPKPPVRSKRTFW